MPLATYSDLKTSVASWIKRADLAANIPDFIALGEARIARDFRLRAQIVKDVATTAANIPTLVLPEGWLEFERFTLDGLGRLEPAGADASSDLWRGDVAQPRNYAVGADAVTLWPTPDGAYGVTWSYYKRFALSDAAPTNWLLTNHPGVYLWAALAEAEPFVMNDARVALWETKYQKEADALIAIDERSRYGGTSMRITTG